jgi:hypothetical protein
MAGRMRRFGDQPSRKATTAFLLFALSCSNNPVPVAKAPLPDGIAMQRERLISDASLEAYLKTWSQEASAVERLWVRVDGEDRVCVDVRSSRRYVLEDGVLTVQRGAGGGAPRPIPDKEPALAGLIATLRSADTIWTMVDREVSGRRFAAGSRVVSLGQPQGWPAGTELVITFAALDDSPRQLILFEPDGTKHKIAIKDSSYDVVFSKEDFDRVQPLEPAPWPTEPLER